MTDGEDSPESLFKRELAKRGLTGGAVKADEREESGRLSCRLSVHSLVCWYTHGLVVHCSRSPAAVKLSIQSDM
jgi:hypothetical protein